MALVGEAVARVRVRLVEGGGGRVEVRCSDERVLVRCGEGRRPSGPYGFQGVRPDDVEVEPTAALAHLVVEVTTTTSPPVRWSAAVREPKGEALALISGRGCTGARLTEEGATATLEVEGARAGVVYQLRALPPPGSGQRWTGSIEASG